MGRASWGRFLTGQNDSALGKERSKTREQEWKEEETALRDSLLPRPGSRPASSRLVLGDPLAPAGAAWKPSSHGSGLGLLLH